LKNQSLASKDDNIKSSPIIQPNKKRINFKGEKPIELKNEAVQQQ
jgi:hypothetical protein